MIDFAWSPLAPDNVFFRRRVSLLPPQGRWSPSSPSHRSSHQSVIRIADDTQARKEDGLQHRIIPEIPQDRFKYQLL